MGSLDSSNCWIGLLWNWVSIIPALSLRFTPYWTNSIITIQPIGWNVIPSLFGIDPGIMLQDALGRRCI